MTIKINMHAGDSLLITHEDSTNIDCIITVPKKDETHKFNESDLILNEFVNLRNGDSTIKETYSTINQIVYQMSGGAFDFEERYK